MKRNWDFGFIVLINLNVKLRTPKVIILGLKEVRDSSEFSLTILVAGYKSTYVNILVITRFKTDTGCHVSCVPENKKRKHLDSDFFLC